MRRLALTVGTGDFWTHQIVTSPDARAIVALQRRRNGELVGLIAIETETSAADLLDGAELRDQHHKLIHGVWRRVPTVTKKPAECYWFHFTPQHTSVLRVSLPAMKVNETVQMPSTSETPYERALPPEQAELMTSDMLRVGRTALIRITLPPASKRQLPPVRVASASSKMLGMSYIGGESVQESILTIANTSDELTLDLEIA